MFGLQRTPENLKETYKNTEKTCKLHTEPGSNPEPACCVAKVLTTTSLHAFLVLYLVLADFLKMIIKVLELHIMD